ncbi:MAG: hypothetical protein ABSC91_04320 [Candidatus Bathyarchaeia archaeon]|jgi:hypothetical protein
MLIAVVAGITLIVSGLVAIMLDGNSPLRLPSVGYIHTIGLKAYWDPTLQNETRQINWGTIYPGSTNNVSFYLQSTSNVPTTLQMTVANWAYKNANDTIIWGPADTSPYMNLTCNCENETLASNQTITATLTLTIDSSQEFLAYLINSNIQQFSMDITLQANEK